MIKSIAPSRFYSLDVLRGLAALQVALFHAGKGGSFSSSWMAVDLFFILSGFILAYRYFSNTQFNLQEFISHRLARLYPLHLFTLLVLFGFYWHYGFPVMTDGTSIGFLENIFLLQSVGFNKSGATWNMPSWSISVEFWVNIIFVVALLRTKSIVRFMLACFMYMIILRQSGVLGVSVDNYFGFLNNGLLRGMASFLLGTIAYVTYKSSKKPNFIISSLMEILATFLLITYMGIDIEKILYGQFLFIPLFFYLILVFSFDAGVLSQTFKFLKVGYLGTMSYSIYLIHTPILIMAPTLIGEMGLIKYLILLGIFSLIAHYLIERPANLYLKNRFSITASSTNIFLVFFGCSLLLALITMKS